jgi:hypothetical protein
MCASANVVGVNVEKVGPTAWESNPKRQGGSRRAVPPDHQGIWRPPRAGKPLSSQGMSRYRSTPLIARSSYKSVRKGGSGRVYSIECSTSSSWSASFRPSFRILTLSSVNILSCSLPAIPLTCRPRSTLWYLIGWNPKTSFEVSTLP